MAGAKQASVGASSCVAADPGAWGNARTDAARYPGGWASNTALRWSIAGGRFGDWEADALAGSKGTGLIGTRVERRSRYTKLGKLKGKRAGTLVASTCSIFKKMPKRLRRTSTFDNGKEFAGFKRIEDQLGMTICFANPHTPWERGTNENTNGLFRDWFPKGSDFRKITAARPLQVERMLNNRPRKRLNYRTPAEPLNALPGVALRN